MLEEHASKPIYIQIAEWLEGQIMSEELVEEGKMYSQYQLADMFTVNPATAGKGLSLLLDQGILFKKRGLGMFISIGAKELIIQKRRTEVLPQKMKEVIRDAKSLHVTEEELIDMLRKEFRGAES
ncbi:GntR family transcriptional regulator [Paenalkalicoccus suaedae]|uniref:GntR family transcriptional regulator n=1 Tax=Paenalkalicoccus suaedae TaxID=2592382 RepID=UPI003D324196